MCSVCDNPLPAISEGFWHPDQKAHDSRKRMQSAMACVAEIRCKAWSLAIELTSPLDSWHCLYKSKLKPATSKRSVITYTNRRGENIWLTKRVKKSTTNLKRSQRKISSTENPRKNPQKRSQRNVRNTENRQKSWSHPHPKIRRGLLQKSRTRIKPLIELWPTTGEKHSRNMRPYRAYLLDSR